MAINRYIGNSNDGNPMKTMINNQALLVDELNTALSTGSQSKLTAQDFSTNIDFSDTVTKFCSDYTQSGNLSFTSSANNTSAQTGNAVYTKLTADGSTISFSSDFVEARNDYADASGTFDVWFTLLPDLKIQYSLIERT
jgi:hypothetical protein